MTVKAHAHLQYLVDRCTGAQEKMSTGKRKENSEI